jgi:hypothetical protein
VFCAASAYRDGPCQAYTAKLNPPPPPPPLTRGQVEVNNVHIRYEDSSSIPSAPFAAGVTFASFTSSAEAASSATLSIGDHASSRSDATTLSSVPTAGLSTASPGISAQFPASSALERRVAKLALCAVYWDPLSLDGAFAELPPGSALTAAFTRGIMTKDVNASYHWYTLQPTSPKVEVLRRVRPDSSATATAAALAAALDVGQIDLSVSRTQLLQASRLSAWVSEHSWLQLRNQLRPLRGVPAKGAPRAEWRAMWRYAYGFVIALYKRQPSAGGLKRWDRSRCHGSVAARNAYISAYARLLGKEADLLAAALQQQIRGGSGGDAAALDTASALRKDRSALADIDAVAALEERLFYEQLVDYRLEARLKAEEGRAQKSSKGVNTVASSSSSGKSGSWVGWLYGGGSSGSTAAAPAAATPGSSTPVQKGVLSPASCPSAGSGFDEAKRRAELLRVALAASSGEAVRLQLSAGMRVCRISLLTGTVTPAGASSNPTQREPKLLTLQFGGSVDFSLRTNGRWSAAASVTSLVAEDDATPSTAFRRVIGPPCNAASTSSPHTSDADGDLRAPPFLTCSVEQVVVESPVALSPHTPHLSSVQPRTATRISVVSQPLEVVLAPAVLRGLATFAAVPAAAALSSGIASGEASPIPLRACIVFSSLHISLIAFGS